jgi:hypothetical protein
MAFSSSPSQEEEASGKFTIFDSFFVQPSFSTFA